MLVELNNENFQKEIQNGLKLVEFYTTWCKYCANQKEILKEFDNSDIWIGMLDCEKYSNIANTYGISGFPSFILFKNGKIVNQFSGYHTKSQLLNKMTFNI